MKILAVVGLSLLLVACGTSEEGAKESGEETNSEEMKKDNSGSMNEESDKKDSEGEEDMASSGSLNVEIMEKEQDHEAHHGSEVSIKLEGSTENPTELTAIIQMENAAIEGASVRFEYWKEEEEKHVYTDAEEVNPGEYQGKTEIMEEGTYNMKVHVEKGEDLHTHKPYTLKVNADQTS
ncbi:FixH family protein [Guptibacillus algicola]|uniref:FixH family protein n=1 Tax=Guptibacillus algicola TaxID=225844 RepID=UPI001CD1A590|nr:FixH family protein [Alkalihalobacillus algicola]MCA0988464.1 FixH family protein [Alkalihalobacillus algicola]